MPQPDPKPALSIHNIRYFIAFRVFFGARFYYPVFTILFLDFGLTLEQFALLNAVWAATIVIWEVPSGALADAGSRRTLLLLASALMVVEMALLCFAPLGRPTLLLVVFFLNRFLSGMAEASASGADEALAYDSLKSEGNAEDWGLVLEKQMRLQSVGFMVAMSVGAAVYDPALMQRLADLLGVDIALTQQQTLRLPIFLTLIMAILSLMTTLRMREVPVRKDKDGSVKDVWKAAVVGGVKVTLQAGRWVLSNPFALVLISGGLLFDHVIRMTVTLVSQYFRLIRLPEATFGLIGSGMATLGLFVPRIGLKLVQKYSPSQNMATLCFLTFMGLTGMTLVLPYAGLLPVLLLHAVIFLTGFFLSYYLNQITSSDQRATVLSIKGLSFNLAYGLIGLFYSRLLALLRSLVSVESHGQTVEDALFVKSLAWFPWYFVLCLIIFLLFARRQLRHGDEHRQV
jgi:MFS family permease